MGEVRPGLLEVTVISERFGARDVHAWVIGLELDRPVEIGQRLLASAAPVVGLAARAVEGRIIGFEVDGARIKAGRAGPVAFPPTVSEKFSLSGTNN